MTATQESPATVRFDCTNCMARLRTAGSRLGRRIRCPKCGQPTLVTERPRSDVSRDSAQEEAAATRFKLATTILGVYIVCSIVLSGLNLAINLPAVDTDVRPKVVLFFLVSASIWGLACACVFAGYQSAVAVVFGLSILAVTWAFVLIFSNPRMSSTTFGEWAGLVNTLIILLLSGWTMGCGRQLTAVARG